jgi:hypothetical protein
MNFQILYFLYIYFLKRTCYLLHFLRHAISVSWSLLLIAPPTEAQLSALLASADQHSIGAVSRFLVRYPVPAFVAVQAHLMAGDLVPAIRLLAEIAQRERLMVEEQGKQDSKTALADGQRQVTGGLLEYSSNYRLNIINILCQ